MTLPDGHLDDALLQALFASDLAQEVRAEFNERRGYGMSVVEATGEVIGSFRHLLERPEEGPVVIVTLAALQLLDGELHATMRDAAVELLREGHGFERRSDETAQRRRERERLREELCAAVEAAAVVDED